MANALGRDLQPGEVVLVAAKHFRKVTPLERRMFRVSGEGFGASAACSGGAVFGSWAHSGNEDRIEGYMIQRAATEKDLALLTR